MKTEERQRARALRRDEGRPIKEIARMVGVATSTVSTWVRDIELRPAQHEALRLRNPAYNRQFKGAAVNAQRWREKRIAYQEEGRRLARLGEPLHVAGCMLYWAEGSRARNQIRFTNSDPEMARFFVTFLRGYFDLHDGDIGITCNLFADHAERQGQIETFWLETLGLPPSSLRKSTVNVYSKYTKKKRQNKLPPDASGAQHLRRHPGVRRFRARSLVGIGHSWPRATRTSATAS